jgi:Holliday junction resolvase
MVNKSKRSGSAFEVALVAYLRGQGWDAERMTLQGHLDVGDVAVREGDGMFSIIEAKATQALTPAAFIKEAMTERDNFCRQRGLDPVNGMALVVWKSPGKPIGDAIVLTTLKEMFGA